MTKGTCQILAKRILEASTIIHMEHHGYHSHSFTLMLDGYDFSLDAEHFVDILTSEKYLDVCEAFIDKLENPVEFMNDERIRLALPKLPKGLAIKVAMMRLSND